MSIPKNQIVYKNDGMSIQAEQIVAGCKLGQKDNIVKSVEIYNFNGKIITFYGEYEIFSCTPDQYVLVENDFIEADEIKIGDRIVQRYKGFISEPITIKMITRSNYNGLVYNYDLTGDKTYNICGFLVHN